MRRRYGIPDRDHRPFNVAYAAARRVQEEGDKKKSSPALSTGGGVNGLQNRSEQIIPWPRVNDGGGLAFASSYAIFLMASVIFKRPIYQELPRRRPLMG